MTSAPTTSAPRLLDAPTNRNFGFESQQDRQFLPSRSSPVPEGCNSVMTVEGNVICWKIWMMKKGLCFQPRPVVSFPMASWPAGSVSKCAQRSRSPPTVPSISVTTRSIVRWTARAIICKTLSKEPLSPHTHVSCLQHMTMDSTLSFVSDTCQGLL